MGWRDAPVVGEVSGQSGPAWAAAPVVGETSVDFDRPDEQVRADIAKLPEAERKKAMRDWADRYVAKERKGGGVVQGATDFVRNFTRGTPVGSWLDEANAATASGLHTVTGGRAGAPYDEAIEYQRATDRAIDKGATKLARIPFTQSHVDTADLTKVAGGIASVPVAPVAALFRGGALLPQMGNALATGVGYGALYGSGQGEDTATNRLMEAGKGAAIGGGLGMAAVPVARGVSNAVGYVADRFRPIPQPLQQYERGAINALSRSTTDDALAAQYQQRVAELGPEGMLADMGPNLRGQASAIANQPGAGQQRIVRALNDRADDAAGRIRQDVDQALGPAINVPETLHATRQYYRQQAAPYRQQFQNNPVPFTQPLDDTLQLLAQHEPGVIRQAARYGGIDPAAGPGQFFARQLPNGQYEITRVPNATEWDYIKRALDGLARGQDANDRRIYGDLARRVRDQVDEAISPGAPQNSPWRQARALEREDFDIVGNGRTAGALEEGRDAIVGKNLTPDELRARLYGVGQPPTGGMRPPEATAYVMGAREGVRNVMGHAATRHGENAAATARSKLGSDFAREKLDILAGPQAAGQLTRRLDAETVFDQTRQGVTQNSATAGRQAAQAEFPNPAARQDEISRVGNKSIPGMVTEGAMRMFNALRGGAVTESRMRVARDAAEMLIAQGQARDNIANALFAYSQTRALNRQQRAAIARLAMQVAEGSRQKAIEARSGR